MKRARSPTNSGEEWPVNLITREKIPPYRKYVFEGSSVPYDLFSLADMIHHAQTVDKSTGKHPHNPRQHVSNAEAARIMNAATNMGWRPSNQRIPLSGSSSGGSRGRSDTNSTADSSRNRRTDQHLLEQSMVYMERWLKGISGKFSKFVREYNPAEKDLEQFVHRHVNDGIRLKMHQLGGGRISVAVSKQSQKSFMIRIAVGNRKILFTLHLQFPRRMSPTLLDFKVLLTEIKVLDETIFLKEPLDTSQFSWRNIRNVPNRMLAQLWGQNNVVDLTR